MARATVKTPPLPLEEAQARLLELATPLPIEHVDVDGALGRFLATPLVARRTQPAADQSAMDGYAVAEGDMTGPWRIVGESAAGHPFDGTVAPGQAVRISTGALMPKGAGAVILQEDIERDGESIVLTGEAPIPPAKHIRRAGLDFEEGKALLAAGTRLGPAQVALAFCAGHKHLAVRRLPRIAIIDSGDELSSDCDACAAHQVPASNGLMLTAMARSLPCDVMRLGPVADEHAAIAQVFERARDMDLIVTSGGASVGDHDLIRPALADWGAELDFWRIAIKPGKPLLVATRERPQGRQIILGLPGNPVSSHVTAFLFMLPLLRALLGAAAPRPTLMRATLGAALKAGGSRREFIRASWDGKRIVPQAIQDSGALASLAASNALIDREVGAPAAQPGDEVLTYLLEGGGIA